jgi:hypothetical protein
MQCRICGQIFVAELTFKTLFEPLLFCPGCQEKFRPGFHHERIPFAKGFIDYVSVYDFPNPDYRVDTWLFRYMEKCFDLAIIRQSAYGLVILFGEREYEDFDAWIPFVKSFEKVLILSLFYFDFLPFGELL